MKDGSVVAWKLPQGYAKQVLGVLLAVAMIIAIGLITVIPTSRATLILHMTVIQGGMTRLGIHPQFHPIAFTLMVCLLLAMVFIGLDRLGYLKLRFTCHNSYSCNLFMFVITILTDIAPNGFLPLPYLGHGLHVGTSCATIVICAAIASQTMVALHQAASLTQSNSYKALCNAVMPGLGIPNHALPFLSTCIILLLWTTCFGNLIAYLGLAGDLLVEEGTRTFLNAEYLGFVVTSASARMLVLSIITLLIWPVCMLEGLDSLIGTVILGNCSVFFAVACMGFRAYDGTYQTGGHFQTAIATAAHQGNTKNVHGAIQSMIDFASGVTVALLTHYNIFFYRQDRTASSFRMGVRIAFAVAAFVYCAVLIFATQTFAQQSIVPRAVILNTYSSADIPMRLSRVAVAASILCSFPLMFTGFRDASKDLLPACIEYLKSKLGTCLPTSQRLTPEVSRPVSTAALLLPVLGVAIIFSDISAVISVLGLVCGFSLVYIIPVLILIGAVHAANIMKAKSIAEILPSIVHGAGFSPMPHAATRRPSISLREGPGESPQLPGASPKGVPQSNTNATMDL